MFKKLSLGLTTLGTVSGACLLFIRPWLQDWGATEKEVQQPLPSDELVPQPTAETTLAVTIKAPARAIWPWLVQMGHGWPERLLERDATRTVLLSVAGFVQRSRFLSHVPPRSH